VDRASRSAACGELQTTRVMPACEFSLHAASAVARHRKGCSAANAMVIASVRTECLAMLFPSCG